MSVGNCCMPSPQLKIGLLYKQTFPKIRQLEFAFKPIGTDQSIQYLWSNYLRDDLCNK